ncbi:MAG: Ribosomal-protein-S5p-alanine acetyltransferase [Candidatus Eremiobacteraeota bacterium]|nr:Ribosomal-protein-S5p-alanine acetyltransferase [Candidatus Eremiobacteraeota bacterium]
MSEGVRLDTERLILREPVASDAPLLAAYHARNEARIARWEVKRSEDVAAHAAWIAWRHTESAAGRARSWHAFDRAAPETLVALVNLDAISHEPQRTAMLAYSVDAAYEGRGYAREACEAVIAHAFGELGLHNLSATYDPANERSGGLLKRLGFMEVARTAVVPGFERHMRAQVLAALARPA